MNDLAGLANKAAEVAAKAIAVSDELHVELAHVRIKEIWPNAKSWNRQFESEDGIGCWVLTGVKLEDDSVVDLYSYTPTSSGLEGQVEELNDILGDIWQPEDHGTIATITYD